jgi:hypothetical protein
MTKKFIPQQKNANRHTLHGLRLLEKSIQADGFIDAQTAAADGEIISGSARLELSADKFADVEPIVIHSDGSRPVIVVRDDIPDASDPRARRLSIAANQIGHTDWNPDGELLKEWGNEDADIKAMFAADEWREATGEEKPSADAEQPAETDRAQELQEKWKVQKGELFLIGKHRLLCGDSTDADLLARLFDGEKYDSMITDPPFFTPATHYQSRVKHQRKFSDLSSLASFWELVMDRTDVYRKHEAHAAVFCNCDSYAVFYPVMFSRFDKTKSLVWDKMHVGLGRIFRHQHELIIWGRNEGHYFEPDGELHADVIACEATPSKDRDHPVEKPAKLYTALVSPLTPKGGITFDPFAGAGLICLAAESYGCKAYAMELDPAYCAVILQRMADAFPSIEIKRLE